MIAVSYLKSLDAKDIAIQKINQSRADLIHVDLMDGKYVGEQNFTIEEVINDLKKTTKLLDIHLMVNNPLDYLKQLISLNIWMVTFHLDSINNPLEVINFLKKNNIKVGIAINPDDNINILNDYLDKIDYCLVMSVYPGKGGQKFLPEVLTKIKYLQDKKILIGIDGGINDQTIKYLKDYRVDNIVSGSYVCMNEDYDQQINNLKNNII